MINELLKKIFGTQSQRDIKKVQPIVEQINAFEAEISKLSDEELKSNTEVFKQKISEVMDPVYSEIEEYKKQKDYDDIELENLEKDANKKLEEVLMEILPRAYAVVRETGKRVLNMRHFDVQLIGGIVLHQGKITEMVTGEGKTLVATLPAYLNALTGKGAHVITVNDYLAERDRNWMGPLYEFLGLTIGVIKQGVTHEQRQHAYNCDITYGTNNEFGFDYLRDNMVVSVEEHVQRELNFCIVDEVDSILIDEARTPLIISGAVDTVSFCYDDIKSQVRDLVNKQTLLIRKFMPELNQAIKDEKAEEIEKLLYLINRGAPKDKEFLTRILSEPSLKRILGSVTLRYGSKEMIKERLALEESLFYTYEEKNREVVLTQKGETDLSHNYPGQFELEDITAIISTIQGDEALSLEEKAIKEQEVYEKYEEKSKRIRSFEQLMKAYVLFQLDVDYVVNENKVVIVDEFTGRMMKGRRFSEGIHEALEAKENVKIQKESQTLATITFQNYFRMYTKLAGMTGTADTEAKEFYEIYKLDVVVAPTNKPLERKNYPDVIYKTEKEKFNAVCNEVAELNKDGRPVLVGTVSIEKSEKLSEILKRKKVVHEVLNAKHHAREADIITLAGQKGSVTIATNMAGRGTDIVLGEGIKEKGGLHIIGTERHESRRVDNQLRGRAGRQGDPGSSRFYLSLEDDLMRIFGSDKIAKVMERLGIEEGQDIQHPLITKAIETAQKRVEGHNFEIRKWVLKYDDVMNKQREVIYGYRNLLLEETDIKDYVFEAVHEVLDNIIERFYSLEVSEEGFEFEKLSKELLDTFRIIVKPEQLVNKDPEDLYADIMKTLEIEYEKKENSVEDKEMFSHYVRWRLFEVVDARWKEHLYGMDELRESVGLRAYGQIDPLIEYQKEGHRTFVEMMQSIKAESVNEIFSMPVIHVPKAGQRESHFNIEEALHPDFEDNYIKQPSQSQVPEPEVHQQPDRVNTYIRSDEKVGRNDSCPCGSGKKYKKCCGR
jgi:preprotein translocase subunit SecA